MKKSVIATRDKLYRSPHVTPRGRRDVHIGYQSTAETLKIGPIDVRDLLCTGDWRPNLVTGDYNGPRSKVALTTAVYYWDQNPDISPLSGESKLTGSMNWTFANIQNNSYKIQSSNIQLYRQIITRG